jgi:hypothetical protein
MISIRDLLRILNQKNIITMPTTLKVVFKEIGHWCIVDEN